MKIELKETKTGKLFKGSILEVSLQEMPFKKDGWQFTWKTLVKVEGSLFYQIKLTDSPEKIQGLLMLTMINEEMVYMNNLEVAPHNYGTKGRYENVAGCLIAFACMKSFELGKSNYLGFLSFNSKTKLIPLYQKKYGAIWTMGQKMFIDPIQGKKLMEEYLKIEDHE